MFDWIGDLFETGADVIGDAFTGIFGGGAAGGGTPVSGLPWLSGGGGAGGGGGLLGLGGGILGDGFWSSPIAGHILGAVGSELLREDPYDLAYDTARGRERGRLDALDFGFTPVTRGNGLAPGAATYNREGGTKPASAKWWEETEEERRRKDEELMGHAA